MLVVTMNLAVNGSLSVTSFFDDFYKDCVGAIRNDEERCFKRGSIEAIRGHLSYLGKDSTQPSGKETDNLTTDEQIDAYRELTTISSQNCFLGPIHVF